MVTLFVKLITFVRTSPMNHSFFVVRSGATSKNSPVKKRRGTTRQAQRKRSTSNQRLDVTDFVVMENKTLENTFSRFRVFDFGERFLSASHNDYDRNSCAWLAVYGAIRFQVAYESHQEVPDEDFLPKMVSELFFLGVITPESLKATSPRLKNETAWSSDIAIMAELLDLQIVVWELNPFPDLTDSIELLFISRTFGHPSASSIDLLLYSGHYTVFPTKKQAEGARLLGFEAVELV